ncbi:MAG: hypothetical protein M1839_008808 [Geoglossum umbratile]|nr:MAG: hypothetical protein M1839_008808 [Geoglossum umbratile]
MAAVPKPKIRKGESNLRVSDVRAAINLQDSDTVWQSIRQDAWDFLRQNFIGRYDAWGSIPPLERDQAFVDFVRHCKHSGYLERCEDNWLAKYLLRSSANNNWKTGVRPAMAQGGEGSAGPWAGSVAPASPNVAGPVGPSRVEAQPFVEGFGAFVPNTSGG